MPSTFPTTSTLFTYKRVASADPAAGSEVAPVVVPANKSWELLAAWVTLVQGLTQTPQPFLVIDDGTSTIAEFAGSSAAQSVSTTAKYTWGIDLPLLGQIGATPNIRSGGPLARLYLPTGFRVGTFTAGIGANTDYGVMGLFVIEYG